MNCLTIVTSLSLLKMFHEEIAIVFVCALCALACKQFCESTEMFNC